VCWRRWAHPRAARRRTQRRRLRTTTLRHRCLSRARRPLRLSRGTRLRRGALRARRAPSLRAARGRRPSPVTPASAQRTRPRLQRSAPRPRPPSTRKRASMSCRRSWPVVRHSCATLRCVPHSALRVPSISRCRRVVQAALGERELRQGSAAHGGSDAGGPASAHGGHHPGRSRSPVMSGFKLAEVRAHAACHAIM